MTMLHEAIIIPSIEREVIEDMRYMSQPWLSLATERLSGKKQSVGGVKVHRNHTNRAEKAEERSRRRLPAIFFAMVKRCSAVECSNIAVKGSSLGFYCFPADPHWRNKWIAGVRRENWTPGKYGKY